MRSLRTVNQSADAVSSKSPRIEKGEKKMARRKLSIEDQLKGVRAAVKSRRTPPQLREGLKRRAEELEKKLAAQRTLPERSKQHTRLHDLLGI